MERRTEKVSLDEHKRRERAQAIGLFRYRLICPALAEELSTKQRGKLVREIAAATHTDPFGNQVRYSRETLDRWIRRYRGGGFEALVPAPRRLAIRTDAAVLELAASLKRENPTRTVAQVARILRTATGWAPSESTLLRHFHRCELMGLIAGEAPAVFGRFEAADPNEMWVGDALHGPRVGDRKTYLFAFLDDHSRLAVGYRFGYAEDTVRLATALKPALAARGVPGSVYVDNGSAFVDAWLLRACAKLGVSLVHSTPGRPQGRGKIERWFRSVREQFLVEVTDTTSADLITAGVDHATALLELNRLFIAWVETEYHRRTHSETAQTPLARWEAGWDRLGRTPAMPTADDLTEAFLWSEFRVVAKTATVSLHANTYQVDPALVGRRVELVSARSIWRPSRFATATSPMGKRCRTSSPATPTPKPNRRYPNPSHHRRPDRLPGVDRGRPPRTDPPRRTHRISRPLRRRRRSPRPAIHPRRRWPPHRQRCSW
jgi:putative transposase